MLRTDHGSLTWLQNFREPEGQLACWLERLQEFDFEIVHRRGKRHTNADAVSRLPCHQCGQDQHMNMADVAAATMQLSQEHPVEELRDAQLSDSALGPLLRGKEED